MPHICDMGAHGYPTACPTPGRGPRPPARRKRGLQARGCERGGAVGPVGVGLALGGSLGQPIQHALPLRVGTNSPGTFGFLRLLADC